MNQIALLTERLKLQLTGLKCVAQIDLYMIMSEIKSRTYDTAHLTIIIV